MKIRLAVRLFLNGQQHSEDLIIADTDALDDLLPKLAAKHADAMAECPGMAEFEFLDEPDPQQRFFRIGTDPLSMVLPVPFVWK